MAFFEFGNRGHLNEIVRISLSEENGFAAIVDFCGGEGNDEIWGDRERRTCGDGGDTAFAVEEIDRAIRTRYAFIKSKFNPFFSRERI